MSPHLVQLALLWRGCLFAQGMAEVELRVTEAAVAIHVVKALPHHALLLQEALVRHQQVQVALWTGEGTERLRTMGGTYSPLPFCMLAAPSDSGCAAPSMGPRCPHERGIPSQPLLFQLKPPSLVPSPHKVTLHLCSALEGCAWAVLPRDCPCRAAGQGSAPGHSAPCALS